MLGRKERDQLELYMCGSLRELIPDDHILVKVNAVLDLSWLHEEVAELYAAGVGRPGIDPDVAVRLMLAGFLLGIVHDRRLMREAQVNIAIRWFVGFGLHEVLPDHSSLTRIRQRWGAERFRKIFERTVKVCVAAKIAKGEIVHVDASLIRADVSWESLAVRHVDAVAVANEDTDGEPKSRKTGKYKKVCVTDPDASMATNGRNRRLEPAYKQHAVVDDAYGVVLDVEVTTGEINEGQVILGRLDTVAALTGSEIKIATADAGYAYAKVFAGMEKRAIEAIIPAKAEPIRSPVPMHRFRYDAKHDTKCPRGKMLKAGRAVKHGRFFTSRAADCRHCDMSRLCLSKGRVNKAVVLGDDYPALLRARRRRERWSDEDRALYQRHRWRSEGYHGEAKTSHGLSRAIRRGLTNMKIQAYLTAAAVNLKRLASAFLAILLLVCCREAPNSVRDRLREGKAFAFGLLVASA
ncbi:transposase [Rhizobium sp. YTU87027]|uniref:transposase n=1 Tax=Rhizobium sp. YTU87027 TaxID=3417741 RepID=UPI003D683E6D